MVSVKDLIRMCITLWRPTIVMIRIEMNIVIHFIILNHLLHVQQQKIDVTKQLHEQKRRPRRNNAIAIL